VGRRSQAVAVALQPLTERVLAAFTRPAAALDRLWALLPPVNAAANLLLASESRSAVWEQSDLLIFLNYAALTLGIVIALWGTGRIARRLEALRRPTSDVLSVETTKSFRELNSAVGPLLISAAAATILAVSTAYSVGWAPALLRGAT
jgi:hypothetical protein